MPRTKDKPRAGVRARLVLSALAAAALLAWLTAAPAGATPLATQLVYAPGQIVPIPAAIPHEEGDMVDRRILPDLRWIAARFPIVVTDGYSGPLPNGEHAGCNNCHVRNSDHYNGLAVDVVPQGGTNRCDSSWAAITRLAHWAEPIQNKPRAPFRWVGYDGDAGHGCGHHLHLSWEHAIAPMFQLAEWVEVFPARGQKALSQPPPPAGTPSTGVKPPKGPQGGSAPNPNYEAPSPTYERGPRGGVSVVQAGGVSPRGD